MQEFFPKLIIQLHIIRETLGRSIKLPTYKSIFFRAFIAAFSVFVFLSALEPKELFFEKLSTGKYQIYAILALTTSIVHISIWCCTLYLYYILNIDYWTPFKSFFLKCFIGFSILCCLYLDTHYLGLNVDLAFFIKWGVIMSPSFAFAILFYEINQSSNPILVDDNSKLNVSISPTFQLNSPNNFLYAITCKKASSLDNKIPTLSNGIYLYFEHSKELQNTTLSNFLLANVHFKEFVRCHDSYIVNIRKVSQFDNQQGFLFIGETKIPVSKKGGNGINGIDDILEKLHTYTQSK